MRQPAPKVKFLFSPRATLEPVGRTLCRSALEPVGGSTPDRHRRGIHFLRIFPPHCFGLEFPPMTLRVATLNLNGVRAAFRKGLCEWLCDSAPDILCAQEVRAQEGDLSPTMRAPAGMRGEFSLANRPGYSGVAVYSRRKPKTTPVRFGHPLLDEEGRFLQTDFASFSVVSLYVPSGSSGEARQAVKYEAMRILREWLAARIADGREWLVCGDINIARTEKDIRNWRGNLRNSGFLPEEREWMRGVVEDVGWRDVFRDLNGGEGEYTWWSNRGRAWENNTGWRIDYHLATPGLASRARRAEIYKAQRFSDHAPLTIEYAGAWK